MTRSVKKSKIDQSVRVLCACVGLLPVCKSQSRGEHWHFLSFHLGEIIDKLCKFHHDPGSSVSGDSNDLDASLNVARSGCVLALKMSVRHDSLSSLRTSRCTMRFQCLFSIVESWSSGPGTVVIRKQRTEATVLCSCGTDVRGSNFFEPTQPTTEPNP